MLPILATNAPYHPMPQSAAPIAHVDLIGSAKLGWLTKGATDPEPLDVTGRITLTSNHQIAAADGVLFKAKSFRSGTVDNPPLDHDYQPVGDLLGELEVLLN